MSKFLVKVAPKKYLTFWLLWKHHFSSKNWCGYFFGNFWGKLGFLKSNIWSHCFKTLVLATKKVSRLLSGTGWLYVKGENWSRFPDQKDEQNPLPIISKYWKDLRQNLGNLQSIFLVGHSCLNQCILSLF